MGFINTFEKIPAETIRKRLGLPNQCGWFQCGWSQCGDDNDNCGVYQQRHARSGDWDIGGVILGKKQNFFMKPAWPENPQTIGQQSWRSSFADAVTAWQGLTAEQKAYYNQIATKKSIQGYNYFISQYLKSS